MIKKKCTAVTDQAPILVMYTAQGSSLANTLNHCSTDNKFQCK